MNEGISLKKNYIFNLILTAANLLFPLITYSYASRVLMPAGIGQASFASSVVNYFAMFAQLGIPTYGIRICAQRRKDGYKLCKTVKELLLINTVMALLSIAVLFLSSLVIGRLSEIRLLLFIYSITILSSILEMSWFYSAMEQYEYITIRSLIIKCLSVAAIFLLVRESTDVPMYAAVTAGSALLTGVVNFLHSRRFIDLRERCRIEFRQHIRPVLVFFLMSVATTVYLNLDTVMLGFMTSDAEVGMYNSAVRVKVLLTGVVTALGTVMLPRMSKLAAEDDRASFARYASSAMNYTLIIAVPMTVYFMAYARECILFLSGDMFLPAVPAMWIIMPTLILIGMTNILGIQILVPTGREKQVLISEIGGAVTDVVLNAIFIPRFGAAGAALGTLCAEGAVLIIQMYYLRDQIAGIFAAISYKKLMIANILSLCVIILIKYIDFRHVIVSLAVSSVSYGAVYFGILLALRESFAVQCLGMARAMLNKIRR